MTINIRKMNGEVIINITEKFIRQKSGGFDGRHDWCTTNRWKETLNFSDIPGVVFKEREFAP
jgi:hypothetical protein